MSGPWGQVRLDMLAFTQEKKGGRGHHVEFTNLVLYAVSGIQKHDKR
jgi:hypothetical protein